MRFTTYWSTPPVSVMKPKAPIKRAPDVKRMGVPRYGSADWPLSPWANGLSRTSGQRADFGSRGDCRLQSTIYFSPFGRCVSFACKFSKTLRTSIFWRNSNFFSIHRIVKLPIKIGGSWWIHLTCLIFVSSFSLDLRCANRSEDIFVVVQRNISHFRDFGFDGTCIKWERMIWVLSE